ncbi:MAG TPA: hypothetical protein DGG94_18560 [Micromonosporaceae bacterium]|nr:hypothetical protein [Micromonosporaceae bacterium]HCU51772.1 hypothetical protein [Micromonosporaceae bacterium]
MLDAAAARTVTGRPPGEAVPETVAPSAVDAEAGPSKDTCAEPAVGHTGIFGCAIGGCATAGALPPPGFTGTDGSTYPGAAAATATGGNPAINPATSASTTETAVDRR